MRVQYVQFGLSVWVLLSCAKAIPSTSWKTLKTMSRQDRTRNTRPGHRLRLRSENSISSLLGVSGSFGGPSGHSCPASRPSCSCFSWWHTSVSQLRFKWLQVFRGTDALNCRRWSHFLGAARQLVTPRGRRVVWLKRSAVDCCPAGMKALWRRRRQRQTPDRRCNLKRRRTWNRQQETETRTGCEDLSLSE